MTPVVLLAGFCVVMATLAVGRLALSSDRDRVDVGTALIVWGITALVVLWAALEEAWVTVEQSLPVAAVGSVLVGTGIVVVAYYLTEPRAPSAGVSDGTAGEADGGRDRS